MSTLGRCRAAHSRPRVGLVGHPPEALDALLPLCFVSALKNADARFASRGGERETLWRANAPGLQREAHLVLAVGRHFRDPAEGRDAIYEGVSGTAPRALGVLGCTVDFYPPSTEATRASDQRPPPICSLSLFVRENLNAAADFRGWGVFFFVARGVFGAGGWQRWRFLG